MREGGDNIFLTSTAVANDPVPLCRFVETVARWTRTLFAQTAVRIRLRPGITELTARRAYGGPRSTQCKW